MSRDLSRLMKPKSIALFGGGWAVNVIAQLQKSGYQGEIWPVNPKRRDVLGVACFASVDDLPGVPDASFIGVNRDATVDVVRALSRMGAGGATCFASGFLESEAEGTGGGDLQQRLVEAAGDMPILGPNCYGLLNYLDNVTLWPDQHGGTAVDSGVAIIAQSSNIAINMTMQKRGLPIACVVAAGNQAQTGTSDIASFLLADPRITAIGLYLEGFGDIRALEAFAARARALGKPVVALKIGRSEKAQAATMTHTASLAGNASASSALLARLGIIEVHSIAVFLETLKLMHAFGPLPGPSVVSVSCSGGEASLMADMASATNIEFRDFTTASRSALRAELGAIVTIANPLDYHTFIWGDVPKMTAVFAAVMADAFDLAVFVLDLPRGDRCDPSGYRCAVDAIIAARGQTGARVAVLASLPENLSEDLAATFQAAGIATIHGMEEGLAAIDAAIAAGRRGSAAQAPVLLAPPALPGTVLLSEADSKAALGPFGLRMPESATAPTAEGILEASEVLAFPIVLKGLGIAHKSEAGAVVLDITDTETLRAAALAMEAVATGYLAEEMITGTVAELIVGVSRESSGMLQLTMGAGGVMAELFADTASLLLPASPDAIRAALARLKISRVLAGYRGRPAADIGAVVDAVNAICRYAEANADRLIELDVNPLIARAADAVAVDALIRLSE
ncbi:acyl-CoA synthetase (NDP forming) [Hoeflea marina]|uniref:Acyl-CoA synthetase (NDP forming) n=1 Tax=Hoeflea marina TaxID=274592 RepID=A0A317PRF4_9HYPH|nr:acetate--CoA ligase family protein [Hoeflea marina]PWW04063.1 acyl-CoA synthetase (NDP forming) [Hoeflea marina]